MINILQISINMIPNKTQEALDKCISEKPLNK